MRHLLIAALLIVAATAARSAETTARVAVTGLTCPSCPYVVGQAMERIESVEVVEFVESDEGTGLYLLRFDDTVTTPAAIVEAVTVVGYGAELVETGGS